MLLDLKSGFVGGGSLYFNVSASYFNPCLLIVTPKLHFCDSMLCFQCEFIILEFWSCKG